MPHEPYLGRSRAGGKTQGVAFSRGHLDHSLSQKNVAGVSVPSRFYNLLVIGRPVLIISEPDAEAALTVSENRLGWVVTPGDVCELAKTIRFKEIELNSTRAAAIAVRFNAGSALARYKSAISR